MAPALIRGVERLLEWADWLVAAPLGLYAAGALALGIVFGVFALGNPGAAGTVTWSLTSGLASGIVAGLCVAAALAMRRRHRMRWWLQAALLPAFVVLWTFVLCLASDASVTFGAWQVCGR
ncbi:MAG TPA: hypothetical protein VGU22_19270 [Methylomirabilota bacterium]|nr:hypothetical protein [Methylomirabilota bacterium]